MSAVLYVSAVSRKTKGLCPEPCMNTCSCFVARKSCVLRTPQSNASTLGPARAYYQSSAKAVCVGSDACMYRCEVPVCARAYAEAQEPLYTRSTRQCIRHCEFSLSSLFPDHPLV